MHRFPCSCNGAEVKRDLVCNGSRRDRRLCNRNRSCCNCSVQRVQVTAHVLNCRIGSSLRSIETEDGSSDEAVQRCSGAASANSDRDRDSGDATPGAPSGSARTLEVPASPPDSPRSLSVHGISGLRGSGATLKARPCREADGSGACGVLSFSLLAHETRTTLCAYGRPAPVQHPGGLALPCLLQARRKGAIEVILPKRC